MSYIGPKGFRRTVLTGLICSPCLKCTLLLQTTPYTIDSTGAPLTKIASLIAEICYDF